MSNEKFYKCIVLSMVKHDYIGLAIEAHPRTKLVAVADDADNPSWVHQRNLEFAQLHNIPYIMDIEKAFQDHIADFVVICSEAERHCDLAVRAANFGLSIISDKPMSNRLSECERLFHSVKINKVKYMLWNRNFLPALLKTKQILSDRNLGPINSFHVDFFFSKDSGPPKSISNQSGEKIDWLSRQIEAHADGSDGGVGNEPMGELMIEGCYPLGYFHFITNDSVKSVFCSSLTHFHQVNFDNGVEDLAALSFESVGGILGSIAIGRIGAHSHPNIGEIRLHITCENGSVVIAEPRPEIAQFYRNQSISDYKNLRIENFNDLLLVSNFISYIEGSETGVLNEDAALHISKVVDACLHSSKIGKQVSVPQ